MFICKTFFTKNTSRMRSLNCVQYIMQQTPCICIFLLLIVCDAMRCSHRFYVFRAFANVPADISSFVTHARVSDLETGGHPIAPPPSLRQQTRPGTRTAPLHLHQLQWYNYRNCTCARGLRRNLHLPPLHWNRALRFYCFGNMTGNHWLRVIVLHCFISYFVLLRENVLWKLRRP